MKPKGGRGCPYRVRPLVPLVVSLGDDALNPREVEVERLDTIYMQGHVLHLLNDWFAFMAVWNPSRGTSAEVCKASGFICPSIVVVGPVSCGGRGLCRIIPKRRNLQMGAWLIGCSDLDSRGHRELLAYVGISCRPWL